MPIVEKILKASLDFRHWFREPHAMYYDQINSHFIINFLKIKINLLMKNHTLSILELKHINI